jgi:2,4-dienoyl-CoA reductase-like NADH-dependent reductase (Old Yellow Enzyme family)
MIRPVSMASLGSAGALRSAANNLGVSFPVDDEVLEGDASPLLQPVQVHGRTVGNRLAVHPMEGWDGTVDGRPTDLTFRRWRRFGLSGAKLVWGGEAVAVCHEGRANPCQLHIRPDTRDDLARLLDALRKEHFLATGDAEGLLVGLQLTHSGRYSRPDAGRVAQPLIGHRHPILDRRMGIRPESVLLGDDGIRRIVGQHVAGAKLAQQAGFDFVDVKHCHGYLGHELLGAHTRNGPYGGSFENRTRFLRETVAGIRAECNGLLVGVRVSLFDTIPFRPDPERSLPGKPGPGVPEPWPDGVPYVFGFGVRQDDPVQIDLTETVRFLSLLEDLDIRLVNCTAGTPYTNPHIQRPALFPPSDAYLPPEDPLCGVARQMGVVRELKRRFPGLLLVGSAYSYLQELLPHVAQAAVRLGWVDFVGLGRMMLSYPDFLRDAALGKPVDRRRICRTFSDCTTAPRRGLPSGCYRLDDHYKRSEWAEKMRQNA